MSYTAAFSIDTGDTGLTLLATLQDTSGTIHASLRNLSCTEVADGFYRFSSSSIPDGYRGYIYFHTGTYTSGLSDIEILASAAINPQELENADIKTSSLSSGTGAYPITVTVTDGTNPLQNAIVRVIEGVTTYTATTDSSGEASFSLDAATYAVTVTKGGYTFTPTTRTVTGSHSGTLESSDLVMSTVVIAAPSNPDLCRLHGVLRAPNNKPLVGAQVRIQTSRSAKVSNSAVIQYFKNSVIATTGPTGAFSVDLVQTDVLVPSGTTYTISCEPAGLSLTGVALTTATKELSDLIS